MCINSLCITHDPFVFVFLFCIMVIPMMVPINLYIQPADQSVYQQSMQNTCHCITPFWLALNEAFDEQSAWDAIQQ